MREWCEVIERCRDGGARVGRVESFEAVSALACLVVAGLSEAGF